MRSIPRAIFVVILAAAAAATQAGAHPGHSHADIPSLIRHPFAGPAHLLGCAAVGLALAGLLYLVTRRVPVPALVRWTGLSAVAIGVAVTLGLSV